MRTHTRRGILGLAIATTTAPAIAHAFDFEELDPTDTVPRRFSVNRFLALSEDDFYKVNLAVRRGRRIIIDGYTPSQSKEIIQLRAQNPAAARERLGR